MTGCTVPRATEPPMGLRVQNFCIAGGVLTPAAIHPSIYGCTPSLAVSDFWAQASGEQQVPTYQSSSPAFCPLPQNTQSRLAHIFGRHRPPTAGPDLFTFHACGQDHSELESNTTLHTQQCHPRLRHGCCDTDTVTRMLWHKQCRQNPTPTGPLDFVCEHPGSRGPDWAMVIASHRC